MGTLRRRLRAMGTTVELTAATPAGQPQPRPGSGGRARLWARLDSAVRWLRRVEATLSRFRPDSELSRLNAAAGRPCLVSPLLSAVLGAALDAARETGGLCDPTVLPCVQAAGYTTSFPELLAGPPPPVRPADGWRPRWAEVALDRRHHLVTLPAGAALDFGGIAKGWAADTIAATWDPKAPLVVDVGGDLRVHVPPGDTEGWPVAVADPFREEQDLARLVVPACGVATSSTVGRRWPTPGGWRHHIIDPRTGAPAASDVVQATVVAPTATAAEAWAKAVCILGSEAGLDFLARRPQAAGLLVRHDGTCLASPNLEVYLDAFYGERTGA